MQNRCSSASGGFAQNRDRFAELEKPKGS